MSDLPAEINYGKVVGTFILAVADGVDVNELPDSTPATGTVTFTPVQTSIKTSSPVATVIAKSLTFSLVDGQVADLQGDLGVWLILGVYKVSYSIAGASIPAHDIEVLGTHTDLFPLDLTDAIPPGGAVLTASQYAELSARIDAVEPADGISVALSNMTKPIVAGVSQAYWVNPFGTTLTIMGVKATLNTAGTTETVVDINQGAGEGTSILSTKITIDATQTDSDSAEVAPVVSNTTILPNGRITFDIDTAGTGATGLIAYIIFRRSV